MQCKNGGWASFDKDNDRMVFQHIPFADHNAMLVRATVNITGRVLEMLATYGYDQNHPAVKRAISFIRKHGVHERLDDLYYIHGGTNTDSVNCPYGTTATGGGYAFGGRIADNPPDLISSRPSGGSMSSGPTDWTISFRQGRVGTSGDVKVYAVCIG